ncbi:MAG: PSD1 domain-containing protein [Candidatus Hydrogenedentes bacterium]|nr:PSD1 domain-containing protein [Candidatus Hydrogenedentota bacterium]
MTFWRSLIAVGIGAAAPLNVTADDFFEQRIRPVLIERCYSCHSTQADPIKAELLLDSAEGIAKGGESGLPAVLPENPAASRLLEALRYGNPELQMPPKEPLPAPVVDDFERWILAGAPFPKSATPVDLMATARKHWAFHPPQAQNLPEIQQRAWPKTEIDHFILAGLEAQGLAPAEEADRRTLIRRLYFNLLGLPPTPEEVAAFVQDTDANAYANLVERCLASPHYGERWGRHWLDVARYADTKGYVYTDREEVQFTHSHSYRNWVVNALNRDLPYDEFLRLQLAANEFEDTASSEDLAAMGFLTLGQRFLGVMPDIIDDRIDTVTRGLMGLTVSCARCHDHKFDPVPTEDYYSLYGVFSASSERTVPLRPEDLNDPRYAAFATEMEKRQAKLRERFAAKSEELERRLRAQIDRYLTAIPTADTLPTDDFYEIRNAEDLNPTIVRRWAGFISRQGGNGALFGLWNRLAALHAEDFAMRAPAVLAHFAQPATPADGDVVVAALHSGDAPRANPEILQAVAQSSPKTFLDVAAAYGTAFRSVCDEWHALLDEAEQNDAQPPVALPDPAREALRAMLYQRDSPIRVPDGAIVDLEWMFDEPSRVELAKLQTEIDRWINSAELAPEFAVVLVDKPEKPTPRVFLRGNPASHGAEVPRQFLELIAGDARKPFATGSGRRELAEAIANAENPLTARVLVNRVWTWHFGAGLVNTPSDFGTRAAAPSHPELLDWLTRNFVEQGWSLKELHRQILLSATYRQSSLPTAGATTAMKVDPENRLLWRFNRHRLDFESLRDALLFASGELDPTPGQRPVDLTADPYPVRRTIYGKIDRQFLPSIFRVFDFPNPDMHNPQRIDTTVPQQALFLMNNPFVQQQARAFAARAEEAIPANDAARVDWFYQCAYQRPPTGTQRGQSLAFIRHAEETAPPPPPETKPSQWSYGWGKYHETNGVENFNPLPHFTGSAWQGAEAWPGGETGWAQITAEGGHPGNDLDHAIVRRWTAPAAGTMQVEGRIRHARTEGDGIRARVVSSRHGVLGVWLLHNTQADTNLYGITVEPGDILDFIVDIKEVLNSDEHLWAPVISVMTQTPEMPAETWNAKAEFADPYMAPPVPLSAWEKYAQVLLSSNEFLYVD